MAYLGYKRLNPIINRYYFCRHLPWIQKVLSHHLVKEEKFLICLVFLSFSLLCIISLLRSPYVVPDVLDIKSTDNYAVIVDCGSSGSRAHIYVWPSWENNPLVLHEIKPLKDKYGNELIMKIEPGLSSVEDNPDEASRYMGPLMDFIATNIPEHKHVDTHIYILATAGLRLLGQRTQEEIMSDLEKDLPKQYKFPNIKAQVITGQEEGMYSWITVNSKAKRFSNPLPKDRYGKKKHQLVSGKTIGVIEMGGASVQVAFELEASDRLKHMKTLTPTQMNVAADSIKEVDLSCSGTEHKYQLFVNTFLGVGSKSAREASVDLLVRAMMERNKMRDFKDETSLTLADPCLPKEASETIKRPKELLLPQVDGKPRQTIGLRYDDDEPSVQIILKGSGSMKQCMAHLVRMIDVAKSESMNCDNPSRCPMSLLASRFIPFMNRQFYGLSEFYYSTHEMIDASGLFNRAQIVSRTNKICLTPFSKLKTLFPHSNEHDTTRVMYECFKSTWLLTFLDYGLKLPKNYAGFSTIETIDGEEIDWTLGAMIERSTELEKVSKRPS